MIRVFVAGTMEDRELTKGIVKQIKDADRWNRISVTSTWHDRDTENEGIGLEVLERYLNEIDNSEIFVLIEGSGCSSGKNIEFGYALGCSNIKELVCIGPSTSDYKHIYATVLRDVEEFIAYLRKEYEV